MYTIHVTTISGTIQHLLRQKLNIYNPVYKTDSEKIVTVDTDYPQLPLQYLIRKIDNSNILCFPYCISFVYVYFKY